MAYLILPHRWNRQPQYPVELDPKWIGPTAAQRSLINPGVGSFVDQYKSGTWTTTGAPTLVGTQYGRAFSFGSGNLYSRTAVSATPDDTGTQANRSETHVLAFTFTSNAAQETVFSIGSAYNDASPHILLQNNSGTLRIYSLTYGTGGPYKDIATVELNKLYVFAFVYGPEANPSYPRYYYLNGRLVWDATTTYSNVSPAQNKFPILGAGYPGYCSNGRILGYYVERGVGCAWPAARVAELGEDFWAMFRPLQRRIYVGPSAGATGVTVNTNVGALALTGLAPSLRQTTSIATGVGALSITGYAPTVSTSTSIATGVGALSITGLAPSLSQATSISTGVGALSITGYQPTVSSVSALTAAVGIGQLSVTGYAPTVTVIAAGAVSPNAGALSITGLQPAISLQERIATGVAALEITGYAPTISSGITIQTGVGQLELAGYAPTADLLNVITPGAAGIVITGYEPTITGGEAVPAGRADAGAPDLSRRKYNSKNRRRKPLLVTIDGQDFVVSSEAEAEALVEQAHEAAEEAAQAKAAEVVKKRLAKQAKDGRLNTKPVELEQPTVEVKPAADGYIDRTWLAEVQRKFDEEISEAYQEAAQQAELQILLRRQEELDDEDRLVALLFTIL